MTRAIGDAWAKGKASESYTYQKPSKNSEGREVFWQLEDESVLPSELVIIPQEDQIIATSEYKRIAYGTDNRWLIIASKNFWSVMSLQGLLIL